MAQETCPVLMNISNEDMCLENFAGLGSVAYFFDKADLASPLVANKEVYSWLETSLKSGKHLYRVELKPESQSITGESNGKRKGFKQTCQMIIETANGTIAEFLRSLNNLDWGVILPDGEDAYQIMYSPKYKISLDAGALKTETGAASQDDRQTTIAPVLSVAKYSNNYVTFPEGKSPEDYVSAAAGE